MPRNESGLDRIVRASLGLALLSLAFTGPCVWVGAVGLVVLGHEPDLGERSSSVRALRLVCKACERG